MFLFHYLTWISGGRWEGYPASFISFHATNFITICIFRKNIVIYIEKRYGN